MGRSAFIALGTNLGARVGHMRAAVEFLQSISEAPIRASFLYETPPWGVLDQPPFLNAVAEIRTSLTPHDLLAELKRAEERLGRVYTRRWGPRQIDLDILLLGDDGGEAVDAEDLRVPHASMHEREFVLRPLCEYVASLLWLAMHLPYIYIVLAPLPAALLRTSCTHALTNRCGRCCLH
jgi:2-amino-4-hydroxy-6-hydroxymethyldihydropteridine diphosphokinase